MILDEQLFNRATCRCQVLIGVRMLYIVLNWLNVLSILYKDIRAFLLNVHVTST